ncbi:E3 ubiquitin-protein ligase rnf213-alpha-like [Dreissena polymorpha]|uniref:E3 ubiquitin-protein ligase rnf213-alpha-like n=1 Tax=Dreissena polymorpha TaxID=45954 RepID=UPI002264CAF6|nr:E3 ubiquitin-protein ligase rnf213-alpha-like [Dreissena polymorpha]
MEMFPPEVCCAAVVYWLRSTRAKTENSQILKHVADGGLLLLDRFKRPGKHTDICSESWEMTSIFSAEVVEILFDISTGDEIVTWGHIGLISNVSCALMNETNKHKIEAAQGRVRSTLSNIINWLNKQSLTEDMAATLKLWNKAFIETDEDNKTIDFWNEDVSSNIQMKITEQVIKDGIEMNLKEMGTAKLNHLRRLFSGLFSKAWNDSVASGNFMLESLLKWNPLRLLIANTAPGKNSVLLEGDLKHKMDNLIKMLHDTWDSIKKGNIQIGALKMISNHVDEFSNLLRMIDPEMLGLQFVIQRQIENRMLALHLFEKQAQQMTIYVNLCQHLKVDTSAIDDILRLQTDGLDKKNLDDICIFSPETAEIHVTAFDSWKEVVDILPTLEHRNKGYVFKKLWCCTCSRVGNNCTTVNDVLKEVWIDVEKRWQLFGEQLKDGTLTFYEFVEMFGSISEENGQRLNDEITLFNITDHVATTRVDQWRKYTRLTACVNGAEAILALQTQYKLEGDFEAMQTIASHSGKRFKMNEFDDSFVATCDILKEVTAKQASCIDAFVKSNRLIKWLKKSISGQQELKVFVDLALLSAGEEPINIAKVQCLYSAVMGYSPLIFDLEHDCDIKQLLEKCRLVWKELDTNTKLPVQLYDTNLQLPWLKEIKRTHGSVETSSLMDAEAINTDGIYIVGSLEKNIEDGMKTQIVQLTVPGIEGERELKKYSLSELQDLQSRLMLVAGKGLQDKIKTEVDVETFTLVFDSVLRLGNVYNKLCAAGCVLFSEWTARFMCNDDVNRPVCLVLSFGKGNGVWKLKGRRSETSSLKEMVPAIAKFMEKCLDDWLLYIKTKRSQFYYLNYFTVDQLVLLQRELVIIGNDSKSELLYPILATVKQDCNQADLNAAIESAKEEQLSAEKKWNDCKEKTENQIQANENDKLKASVICELMDMNYSEKIARMALENVDENNTETSFLDQEPLIDGLQNIWNIFVGSISSKLRDFISLEFLGMILNHLSEPETMKRELPSYFLEGQPNLLICPKDDILKATLTIYEHDKSKPLPSSDEILICHTKTSQDEVDIFWRRAIFGSGGKIYCLVHADLLNYDAGVATQKTLEQNILEANGMGVQRYRLIIICGSDNECRSPFVAALDKYVRHIEIASHKAIKEYVTSKMIVPATITQSASCVDFERSSSRVIKSSRPGVGKTLYITKRFEELKTKFNQSKQCVTTKLVYIPLQEKQIDIDEFMNGLLDHTSTNGTDIATLFHIDISCEVIEGIDYLLFNLLILGCLTDSKGLVWRRRIDDLYMIETIPSMSYGQNKEPDYVHTMLAVLPDVFCKSPIESISLLNGNSAGTDINDQLFGEEQFQSEAFQRTFQYLNRQDGNKHMNDIDPSVPEGLQPLCLEVLLRHCGVKNPSWSELNHFVWFLNLQLVDFKQSPFVGTEAEKYLPGFAKFVLRFLIKMSRDFSTRSLNLGEEPHIIKLAEEDTYDENSYIKQFQMKRTWESSPHPYLFFNADHNSFTFLGFFIDENTGNLMDMQTKDVLETGIMDMHLYRALQDNKVPLKENFDKLTRDEQIHKMCRVIGVENPCDPDPTYELTTDNAKKIMAIYMRFRCDIPVIIMGETGCGKTRLVKFMCALQAPKGSSVKTMIIMKVHGGTTKYDIKRTVKDAEEVAKTNGPNIYTVLFFDEANTTEAVGVIKEIMCDKSICGQPLKLFKNLKMIAACNPYRKHPKELIKKLEQAGLGYHVDADDTCDRLGRIPMRRLVYRVQPLPHSLLPMVWDFGQLDESVEQLYIKQMIKQLIRVGQLPTLKHLKTILSSILTASQKYMRDQKDDCSFVSLRDVERALNVMVWFYSKSNENRLLFKLMDTKMKDGAFKYARGIDDLTKSLILALGVCYHACLQTRQEYRQFIARLFVKPFKIHGESHAILAVIECCQDVVIENLSIAKNIARNTALKENIFMMVICIELRIPLFLVGKPGSSKSLAKTIVADAMQGNSAKTELFRNLKQVQIVSYQCSPLSTPDGIVATFRQCAEFQKDKNLRSFVSVVVLDEVGLAEDSPRMPLKTLHPLLEDGCQSDETQESFKKVAFIGISNWALDPAKMNRGISVKRDVPGLDELIKSARGICKTNLDVETLMEPFIEPISKAYIHVFETALKKMREFYGLRDFYSLVKMLSGFVAETKKTPTWPEMLHAIKRNFGGLDLVNPEKYFKKELSNAMDFSPDRFNKGPDCSTNGLIEACLFDSSRESRYLLLLTENDGALGIVQQMLARRSEARPITLFGSSFPSDQKYTQVCRNINKIKVCMETGNTVVLLNLENLYESLYDALNQYYVRFGGQRYVDLGLGTHRVKCLVHKKFRLIVVADKEVVYKKFPIPLINRLEKHFLTVNTILNNDQIDLAKDLRQWANRFANKITNITRRSNGQGTKIGDVLIGFNDDTCSSIILNIIETKNESEDDFCKWKMNILEEGKRILLWSATPEALVRTNELSRNESNLIMKHYFELQAHGSVIEYLKHMIVDKGCQQLLTQITCHSKLLPCNYDIEIRNAIPSLGDVDILSLVSFDTEQQFSNRIRQHFDPLETKSRVIIIQCDSGDANTNLIACARYSVMDALENKKRNLQSPIHILFIVQLPRISGGCFNWFQCGPWHSVHIDDLYPEGPYFPHLRDLQNRSVSEVFERACDGTLIT